jgi:hypothetical protein
MPEGHRLIPNGPLLWWLDELEAARDALLAKAVETDGLSPNHFTPPGRKNKQTVDVEAIVDVSVNETKPAPRPPRPVLNRHKQLAEV